MQMNIVSVFRGSKNSGSNNIAHTEGLLASLSSILHLEIPFSLFCFLGVYFLIAYRW